jgi:hypothetical protein
MRLEISRMRTSCCDDARTPTYGSLCVRDEFFGYLEMQAMFTIFASENRFQHMDAACLPT